VGEVVDGILARLTAGVVALSGTVLRAAQTGVVHAYGAVMVVGLVAVGWFFTAPHPRAVVREDRGGGRYAVEAGPGLGYGFRWTTTGDKPDTADFAGPTTVEVEVPSGEVKVVKLEVRNAFGRVASTELRLGEPAVPSAANEANPRAPEAAR
jgi:hypothetical protein